MSRQTKKYMFAIRILADVLACKALDVSSAYSNREAYAELASRGYRWSQLDQRWVLGTAQPTEQPQSTFTSVHATIRVMCDEMIDTEICTNAIITALEDVGYTVTQKSRVVANHNNSGARQYFDVLL